MEFSSLIRIFLEGQKADIKKLCFMHGMRMKAEDYYRVVTSKLYRLGIWVCTMATR